MEGRFLLLLSVSVFAVGTFVGFFISNALQNQIQALVGAAVVLAILTWIGSGADFLGLLREWYKDHKQEKMNELLKIQSMPKLTVVYDERENDQYCPSGQSDRIAGFGLVCWKYLRIRVKNEGGGQADGCEGILRVERTTGQQSPSLEEKYLHWAKNSLTSIDIPPHKDAFLDVVFSINKMVDGRMAFVSTPFSINGPQPPRTKDGFGPGDYDLILELKPANGAHLRVQFVLEVKAEWDGLSMKKIE